MSVKARPLAFLFKRRVFLWIGVTAGAAFLAMATSVYIIYRPDTIKRAILNKLSERLNMDAAMEEFEMTVFPKIRIDGSGLTLRVRNQPDLPPVITIRHFSTTFGLIAALRVHVSEVHVDGLAMRMPPAAARNTIGQPAADGSGGLATAKPSVIIDRLITHDAVLMFVPKAPNKPPLTFPIHELEMFDLGFGRAMPFHSKLTNPKPNGEIDARGTFGPWNTTDVAQTPVDGDYVFSNADLSTINGIGGTLASTGKFGGRITEINVKGETRTPDFSLDLGGKPVPLSTTFEATVDGTDATTILNRVDALLGNTTIVVSGSITNLPGPGRHPVNLTAQVTNGRIQDLLQLAIDAPKPMMVGRIDLHTTLSLPPGPSRARDRLSIQGKFGLAGTTFTDKQVQGKIDSLSQRSQGKDHDQDPERVFSNISGGFRLATGVLTLTNVAFEVPGASVTLDGTYGLEGGALDFRGALTMKASVSKAMGGFKSVFLKLFDPLFKKPTAGAVVPIKIGGTLQDPKPGLDVKRVMKRK